MKIIKLSLPYILWGLFLGSFILFLSISPEPYGDKPTNRLDKIKLFNLDRSSYVEWDREKAIEFGLNQIVNTFYYLFVAAAGLLAFITRILIDPIIERKRIEQITSFTKNLLLHSGVLCLLSMLFGFYSRLYFNNISDREEFSLYDEFGTLALYQILAFVCAAIIFLIALVSISKTNTPVIKAKRQNKAGKMPVDETEN